MISRTLFTGLALSLFATLPGTSRAEDKPKITVETLKADLDELRKDLNVSIQQNKKTEQENTALRKDINQLEKSLMRLVGTMESFQKEQTRMSLYLNPNPSEQEPVGAGTASLEGRIRLLEDRQRDLDRRLRDTERELSDLRARMGGAGRPSLTQDTGTIVLDNSRWAQDSVFIISGTSYRVPAFQTRTLTGYQAGTFTFQVLVDGALEPLPAFPAVRTLQRNQVFRLFTY